jgi:hypothetical protein
MHTPPESALQQWQGLIESASHLATVVAVVIGGSWALSTFLRTRRRHPRAIIEHASHVRILRHGHGLLHVAVKIANNSEVRIRLSSALVRLYRVSPLSDEEVSKLICDDFPLAKNGTEYDWENIGERLPTLSDEHDIEPGASETFHFDFVLRQGIRRIQIYTYFENRMKSRRPTKLFQREVMKARTVGWDCVSYISVDRTTPLNNLE